MSYLVSDDTSALEEGLRQIQPDIRKLGDDFFTEPAYNEARRTYMSLVEMLGESGVATDDLYLGSSP